MRLVWAILLVSLLTGFQLGGQLSGGNAPSFVPNVEEFPGPFASWTNVQSAPCNATGNGSTDDTAAIQTCLNNITPSSPVLYFPAGTYKITAPLSMTSQQYVSLIGADPTTTKILFGAANVTGASFTGTIANNAGAPNTLVNTLTASAVTGTIKVGQTMHGFGGTYVIVTAYGTGTGGAGTYQINALNQQALSFPSPTAFTTTNDRMLYLNGVSYSRINRLTFDGGTAVPPVAITQSWNNVVNYFDTGNEFRDDAFVNLQNGYMCGDLGYGCADVSLVRDKFTNLTDVGFSMNNFNALDVYCWYCLFSGNRVGAANLSNFFGNGGGNFHVMGSNFLGNTEADINIANTGTFNFGSNYSSGSARFIEGGGSNSVNNYVLSGNTVLDTTADPTINQGSLGPMMLVNNVFRSRVGASAPVASVTNGSTFPTDIFSYGNTYTISTATCGGVVQVSNSGHCHSVSDQIVARGTVNPVAPTLPAVPANQGRTLFEASVSGAGTTCSTGSPCALQTAITQAAACSCTNPVVHIIPGNYNLATTITVPANFPIQIVGDGFVSRLLANGANPVLRLTGPSKATLSNFSCNGNAGASTCIEATGSDQAGGRVFIDQGHSTLSNLNFLVDSLDRTSVEMHLPENINGGTIGLKVIGGASASSGTWLGSTTNVFGGISSDQPLGYSLTNGAHLTLWGPWNDIGSGGHQVLSVAGQFGSITYAGSKVLTNGGTSLALSNFQGVAGLVGLYLDGNVSLTGTGSGAQNLGAGLVGPSSTFFSDTTSPAATTVFINGFSTASPPPLSDASELPETGSLTAPFLGATLAQLIAATPVQRTGTTSGVTDIGMYRIFVDRAVNGVWVH